MLHDPEKRAAYDQHRAASTSARPADFQPPPGWDAGFEFRGRGDGAGASVGDCDHSDFFEALFGRRRAGRRTRARRRRRAAGPSREGHDRPRGRLPRRAAQHLAARAGGRREGHGVLEERHSTSTSRRASAPASTCAWPGRAGPASAVRRPATCSSRSSSIRIRAIASTARTSTSTCRSAPWEAALGATVDVPTPEGEVQLTVPPGSAAGRKLRLKGKGIPSQPPGDLYAVLSIALPPAETPAAREAYAAMAKAFAAFHPRT